jgi:hypothetical protein
LNYILLTIISINVIKRTGSKCKYVEIFTHRHVGSTGAPSRRKVFVRGTSAEQRESPEIAGRNTKAKVIIIKIINTIIIIIIHT